MRTWHVDLIHNNNIFYYYDIKAENKATAIEKAIAKHIREQKLEQLERRNIVAQAY